MNMPERSPEHRKLAEEALKRLEEEKTKLAAMTPWQRKNYIEEWAKRLANHMVELGESERPI